MKVSHIEFLQPEERLFLFDHYINYCQTQILYMKSEAKDMIDDTTNQRYPMSPRRLELTLDMMQHFVDQWQAELDWVRRLRKQEIARIEADPHNNTRGKEEKSRELI